MPFGVNLNLATSIAEEYVRQLRTNGDFQLRLFSEKTIERDFGWVFFWGSNDPSTLLAGNAPFIVDRKDGSVHVTGTAYPIEEYIDSYDRVGRAYPFAVAEHRVILAGWRPGILKISLTKAIRKATGKGLAEAKNYVDEVVAGRYVTLTFPTATEADTFSAEAQQLGIFVRREIRYC